MSEQALLSRKRSNHTQGVDRLIQQTNNRAAAGGRQEDTHSNLPRQQLRDCSQRPLHFCLYLLAGRPLLHLLFVPACLPFCMYVKLRKSAESPRQNCARLRHTLSHHSSQKCTTKKPVPHSAQRSQLANIHASNHLRRRQRCRGLPAHTTVGVLFASTCTGCQANKTLSNSLTK